MKAYSKKARVKQTHYHSLDCRQGADLSEFVLSVFSLNRIRLSVVLFLLSMCSCVMGACLMYSEIGRDGSYFADFRLLDVFGMIHPLTPFFLVSLLMAVMNIVYTVCISASYRSFTGKKEEKAALPLRIAAAAGIGADVISMFTFFGFFEVIYGRDYSANPFLSALPPIIISFLPLLALLALHICILRLIAGCEKNSSQPDKKSIVCVRLFALLYCIFAILLPFGFIDLFMLQLHQIIFGIVLSGLYALPAAYLVRLAGYFLKTELSPTVST